MEITYFLYTDEKLFWDSLYTVIGRCSVYQIFEFAVFFK